MKRNFRKKSVTISHTTEIWQFRITKLFTASKVSFFTLTQKNLWSTQTKTTPKSLVSARNRLATLAHSPANGVDFSARNPTREIQTWPADLIFQTNEGAKKSGQQKNKMAAAYLDSAKELLDLNVFCKPGENNVRITLKQTGSILFLVGVRSSLFLKLFCRF